MGEAGTTDLLLNWMSSAKGKDKLFRLIGYTSYFVSDSDLILSLITNSESDRKGFEMQAATINSNQIK